MSPTIQQALPKFLQIANHIRGQIARGELRPGDEVPSERQIAEEWRVSRPTATRALAALRAEELVEARQGAGTFVREQPRLHRRARDRYERARSTGKVYVPGEHAEITHAEAAPAPEAVAVALGVPSGTRVIRRRRIVVDDSGPTEVSTSWFSAEVGRQARRLLSKTRIREGTLAYVEQATGRQGWTAMDRISARLASQDEAAALGLPQPVAVLVVHHTTYDSAGQPLEFAEAVYPPGRWSFEDQYEIPG
jgi:GntR family transcriptional regulator